MSNVYDVFSAEALVSVPMKSEIPLNYMIVEVCILVSIHSYPLQWNGIQFACSFCNIALTAALHSAAFLLYVPINSKICYRDASHVFKHICDTELHLLTDCSRIPSFYLLAVIFCTF